MTSVTCYRPSIGGISAYHIGLP